MAEQEPLDQLLAAARTGLSPTRLERSALQSTLRGELRGRPLRASARASVGAVAGALLGVGFAAGYAAGAWVHSEPRARSSEQMPAPITEASPASVLPVRKLPAVEAPLPSPPLAAAPATVEARSSPKRPAHVKSEGVSERSPTELELLRRVDRALRTGNTEVAAALLGELDERYPKTLLVEERAAAKVMTACRAEGAGAREDARGFITRYPSSVYRERVSQLCDELSPSVREPASEGSAAGGQP